MVRLLLLALWVPLSVFGRADHVVTPMTERALHDAQFGGQIMTYTAGDEGAPLVVLVHGLGDGGARDWDSVVPMLAKTYRVLALDLPGFGQSDQGNHLYSPETLAKAVHGAIRQLDSRRFVLVGHSLGAAVALAYAHRYPDDLDRLILVSMAGVLHRSVYADAVSRAGIESVTGIEPSQESWLGRLAQSAQRQVSRVGLDPTVLLAKPWLRQIGLRGDPQAIAALALAAYDFGPALHDVRTPTQMIWGRDDDIAPVRVGHVAAALMHDARLVVRDDFAHMPMLEAPEVFKSLLREAMSADFGEPPQEVGRKPPESIATTRCVDEPGGRFSGSIGHLDLSHCGDVVIENANIGLLTVNAGSVTLVNSHVHKGIVAFNSQLTITAGTVAGEPPLALERTELDAAGTRFIVEGPHLVKNQGATPLHLRFSVASRQSPDAPEQRLHDLVQVDHHW